MAIVEKCWVGDDGGPRVQEWVQNVLVDDGIQGAAAVAVDVGRNVDSAQARAVDALDAAAAAADGAGDVVMAAQGRR